MGDKAAVSYTARDQFYGKDGTDEKPAYSYTSDHSLGITKTATGEQSFIATGTKRLRVSASETESTGPYFAQTSSSPTYTFSGATSSGFGRSTTATSMFSGSSALSVSTTAASTTGKIMAKSNSGFDPTPQFTFTGSLASGMCHVFPDDTYRLTLLLGGAEGFSFIEHGDLDFLVTSNNVHVLVAPPLAESQVPDSQSYTYIDAICLARIAQTSPMATGGLYSSLTPVSFGTLTFPIPDISSRITTNILTGTTRIVVPSNPATPNPGYGPYYRVYGKINWSVDGSIIPFPIVTLFLSDGTSLTESATIVLDTLTTTTEPVSNEVRFHEILTNTSGIYGLYASATSPFTLSSNVTINSCEVNIERLFV